MPLQLSPIPVGPATSSYYTYNEFIRRWGLENVRVAANKDNNDAVDPDVATVQDAFNYGDSEVANYFADTIYKIPFDFTPNGGGVPFVVKDWAMTLAYGYLYTARGFEDKNTDRVGNKIYKLVAGVYIDMGFYRSGIKSLNAAAGSDGSGNLVTIQPTPISGPVDTRAADGSPIVIVEI